MSKKYSKIKSALRNYSISFLLLNSVTVPFAGNTISTQISTILMVVFYRRLGRRNSGGDAVAYGSSVGARKSSADCYSAVAGRRSPGSGARSRTARGVFVFKCERPVRVHRPVEELATKMNVSRSARNLMCTRYSSRPAAGARCSDVNYLYDYSSIEKGILKRPDDIAP
ncbi:hypothetical protein EVAR_103369_1 [Eumeta japonica]|uniref:Uncharacterized protein n=1 Tax=Eumeta variegata TaxID=151549 RepID=A0A4C1Y830_EUMVA|nr:hypothetical protein EVAR_103369_1 [Eumeta japonica]